MRPVGRPLTLVGGPVRLVTRPMTLVGGPVRLVTRPMRLMIDGMTSPIARITRLIGELKSFIGRATSSSSS